MKVIRNILVIVDPSVGPGVGPSVGLGVDAVDDVHPAIAKAANIAHAFGAAIELFICDYRAGLDARNSDADRARALLLQQRRERLEGLAKPLREQGLDVSIDATFCNPLHEGVLRKLAKMPFDMVIKDTHHHSILQRTFITNTDWHLIRSCTTPLLLVKPTRWSSSLQAVAAVDPGHTGDKPAALDSEIATWAQALATKQNGTAHAVHAFIPTAWLMSGVSAGSLAVAPSLTPEVLADEKRTRWQLLSATVAPCGVTASNIHLLLGSPVEQLPQIANSLHADVMVMGAVSRNRMQRLFVGSTAEQVLEHLPCDVLIVKPLDFTSDLPF